MRVKTLLDFSALKLTPVQERLTKEFFVKLLELIRDDPDLRGPDSGIALCTALTDVLAVAMLTGIRSGALSEERLRVLIDAINQFLPKAS